MGTRGLQGYRVGGEDKVSYHHYDCYPSGLGKAVLKYVRGCGSIEALREQAQAIEVVDDESAVSEAHMVAAETLHAALRASEPEDRPLKYYPEVSLPSAEDRADCTYADLLDCNVSLKALSSLGFLVDSTHFLSNCLFNEWTYIINVWTMRCWRCTTESMTDPTPGAATHPWSVRR
ncbi:hypothetical protein KIPB_006789 [Kipferlia bialata]|uniref:Uncharacterized protein n=1 Tax=Kipferlia bialata TaxID=797122 RepID=A0A391NM21_9EUKA|nr:hypothetical protein KIPB_006789 [Kipferlia bialata]|eukprot:g6789.t1